MQAPPLKVMTPQVLALTLWFRKYATFTCTDYPRIALVDERGPDTTLRLPRLSLYRIPVRFLIRPFFFCAIVRQAQQLLHRVWRLQKAK